MGSDQWKMGGVGGSRGLGETGGRMPPSLADWKSAATGEGAGATRRTPARGRVGLATRRAGLELAVELGVAHAVRFEGYQQNVRPYLAAMDLFIFPSHKEAMGIALVEAMAEGLPKGETTIQAVSICGTPE